METNLSYKTHLEIDLRSYSTDGLTDSSAPELNITGGIDKLWKLWNHVFNKKSQQNEPFFNVIMPLWKKMSKRYNCTQ